MNPSVSRHATRALRVRGLAIVLSAAALLMAACDGAGGNGGTAAKSSAKDITSFRFAKSANDHLLSDRNGTIAGSAIAVSLAPGKALTALVPTITVSPKASVVPASGTAQDFTNPVTYTVTAENGSTKAYTVTVRADLAGITAFVFEKERNTNLNLPEDLAGTISGSAINVELPPGSSRTGLTPTITLTEGATVSPAGGVARDFTNQVGYTVTFEGGTTRSFTVTVTVKAATGQSSANYITGFEFVKSDTENRHLDGSRPGKIAGSDIAVSLAPGKALTALVPTITVSPKASVVPASGTARDFTNPVTYTVTAEDGKTKREYTVTVRADMAGITGFVFEKANNAAILPEDLPGTITGTAINVELLPGRSRAEMTPTITLTAGATVSPASGVARDFTNPVDYTVTSPGGSTQRFTVTVTVKSATGLSSANDITGFEFVKSNTANRHLDRSREGKIAGSDIAVSLAPGKALTALVPTIAVSPKASVVPASGTARDFTNPVTYTVTAENGSTKAYTVTVRADLAGIKGFVFEKANNAAILPEDLPGTITGTAINVELLPGRSRTGLTPTITLIAGATVSPESGEARDFTNPVDYTVTLSDNTTQRFTVTVTVKAAAGLSSANNITGFKFVKEENLPALANEPDDVPGAIQGTTITALPASLLSDFRLKPTIVVSAKAVVSPAGGRVQDFTNPVTYTVTAENGETQEYTVTLTKKTLHYKGDPSLSAHNGKFSLGDFDGSRLFVGKGFTGADEVGKTLQSKITIKTSTDTVHDGAKTAMGAAVAADGSFAFGISNFAAKTTAAEQYTAWAAIVDNTELSIEVVLYAEGGATELGQKSFTATKTANGDIHTWRDLQNMKYKLNGSYTLQNDIGFPATGTEGLADGARQHFTPVGNANTPFAGSLDGNDKTISGLYIRRNKNAGLFGSIQAASATVVVKDLTLDGPDVSGSDSKLGSVAGHLNGSISNVIAKDVKVGHGVSVGGLVGNLHFGTLQGEVRSGSVQGAREIGGLVGTNFAGTVRGTTKDEVTVKTITWETGGLIEEAGGLVGDNSGNVVGLSAATVEGRGKTGGLVGFNTQPSGKVWGIFSGKVTGTGGSVGGLVGLNRNYAEVRGWSTAAVSGASETGGLVGDNDGTGKVQGYALGYVSATSATNIGAVIGRNQNTTNAADVAVFAGQTQAEETANGTTLGSGDHVGVISTTPPAGVQRTSNNVGSVQVESTTAPTLTGLTYGTAQGTWKTETGKKWPVLNFRAGFPEGQPPPDPAIPDKPANFYE